jgi:hypothetical protein
MTSAHRAENIFPKYLLYYLHEIARKYPREKNRYSSFSDGVWEQTTHARLQREIQENSILYMCAGEDFMQDFMVSDYLRDSTYM